MSSLPSKDYASKTRKVLCGYCSKEWREANLEAHCKNVHGKPKLIKGEQNILKTNYFSRTTKKGVDTTIDDSHEETNCTSLSLPVDMLSFCFNR